MNTTKTYEQRAKDRFKPILERLRDRTKDCLIDMHEPDNADVHAIVTGTHLDNAMGHEPTVNQCEFTVGLSDSDGNDREWFNLADLIALARIANLD